MASRSRSTGLPMTPLAVVHCISSSHLIEMISPFVFLMVMVKRPETSRPLINRIELWSAGSTCPLANVPLWSAALVSRIIRRSPAVCTYANRVPSGDRATPRCWAARRRAPDPLPVRPAARIRPAMKAAQTRRDLHFLAPARLDLRRLSSSPEPTTSVLTSSFCYITSPFAQGKALPSAKKPHPDEPLPMSANAHGELNHAPETFGAQGAVATNRLEIDLLNSLGSVYGRRKTLLASRIAHDPPDKCWQSRSARRLRPWSSGI